MNDEPRNLEELCEYIEEHAAAIYVWHNGENRSLTELPAELAIHHALRFIKAGQIPFRIGDPGSRIPNA